MDEKQTVMKLGSLLRAYSYDLINTGVLGPWKGLLDGKATTTLTINGDTLVFTEAETHEGEVTGLAKEVKSLQATIKEQAKTIKAQKKTIEGFEEQKSKETKIVEVEDTYSGIKKEDSGVILKPRRVKQ